jgi:hypothetical protein
MISKKDKIGVESITKLREHYLKKTFNSKNMDSDLVIEHLATFVE